MVWYESFRSRGIMSDALENALIAEIEELNRRLEGSADFRRLKVAEKALRELRSVDGSFGAFGNTYAPVGAGGYSLGRLMTGQNALSNLPSTTSGPALGNFAGGGALARFEKLGNSTIEKLALTVLRDAGRPLSTKQLLPKIKNMGKDVGGQNPLTTLSNILSQSSDVASVQYGNRRAWWFEGEPFPDFQTGEAAN
jgi:hypothetical protein